MNNNKYNNSNSPQFKSVNKISIFIKINKQELSLLILNKKMLFLISTLLQEIIILILII
jgi:hypothetical protein